jgi:hypothetical protein
MMEIVYYVVAALVLATGWRTTYEIWRAEVARGMTDAHLFALYLTLMTGVMAMIWPLVLLAVVFAGGCVLGIRWVVFPTLAALYEQFEWRGR